MARKPTAATKSVTSAPASTEKNDNTPVVRLIPNLVRGQSELLTYVKETHELGKNYHDRLHIAAVSVLVHAAENGQVEPLNVFYRGLRPAYQGAFRQYAIRHCAYSTPEQFDNGQGAGLAGWLYGKLEDRGSTWRVCTGKKDGDRTDEKSWQQARKDWVEANGERLMLAKDKNALRFFDKEQRSGVNQDLLFTNADVLVMLDNVLKKIRDGEKGRVLVNPNLIQTLEGARELAAEEAERLDQEPKMKAPEQEQVIDGVTVPPTAKPETEAATVH